MKSIQLTPTIIKHSNGILTWANFAYMNKTTEQYILHYIRRFHLSLIVACDNTIIMGGTTI